MKVAPKLAGAIGDMLQAIMSRVEDGNLEKAKDEVRRTMDFVNAHTLVDAVEREALHARAEEIVSLTARAKLEGASHASVRDLAAAVLLIAEELKGGGA